MKTYSISGDLGDIVCMLAVLRASGGGHLRLFRSHLTTYPMTPERADALIPLLTRQDYIGSARYVDTPEGTNLDVWRKFKRDNAPHFTLLDAMSWSVMGFKLNANSRWLDVQSPNPVADVLFHRTRKAHNTLDWGQYRKTFPHAAFIGLPDEHAEFESLFGRIPYYPTDDLYEFARLIAGSRLLVCNQSVGLMIAYGLGQPVILDQLDYGVCYDWKRANVHCVRALAGLP